MEICAPPIGSSLALILLPMQQSSMKLSSAKRLNSVE